MFLAHQMKDLILLTKFRGVSEQHSGRVAAFFRVLVPVMLGSCNVKLIVPSIIALLAICFIGFSALSVLPPPDCATDISTANARSLVASALVQHDFSEQEAGTVEILNVLREESESWPTYITNILVMKSGVWMRFAAVGNGCGVSELVDLGPDPARWHG